MVSGNRQECCPVRGETAVFGLVLGTASLNRRGSRNLQVDLDP